MTLTKEEIKAFWNAKCNIDGFEDTTNKEWAKDVLLTLFIEGEGFSGKRPNCNSGWEFELLVGIVRSIPRLGVIHTNEWDEEDVTFYGEVDIDKIYKQLIKNL